MKKIINGRVYNTATATLIQSKTKEKLYLSRGGKWFLIAPGHRYPDYWYEFPINSREYLIPIGGMMASTWLNENNFQEEFRKYFPEVCSVLELHSKKRTKRFAHFSESSKKNMIWN
ncbi:MAG TPA: hypothetical protein VNZ49_09630 [Bacteroidia bacterium]|jgi:hypothetical protein|nr:hypothetical protein [Bacteroidia bacterium]